MESTNIFSSIESFHIACFVISSSRQKKINLSYEKIVDTLSKLRLTEIFTSAYNPSLYKLNKHSLLTKQLYDKLKLKPFLPE